MSQEKPNGATPVEPLRKLRRPTTSRTITISLIVGALLLLFVALLVGASTGLLDLSSVAWGTVPNWISAVLGLGAAVGVGVAVLTYRDNQRDRRDDEHQQARLVQACPTPIGDWPPLDDHATLTVKLAIANHSSEPVFDLRILDVAVVPLEYDPISISMSRHKPVRASLWVSDLAQDLHTLDRLDSNTRSPTVHAAASELRFDTPDNFGFQINCHFEFTDARGRRWQRIGGFRPTRTTSPEEEAPPRDVVSLFS